MPIQSTSNSGIFPKRNRERELKETDKQVRFKKIPENLDELADARSIRSEELPITLQSEAFDVGFSEPIDFRTTRRLDVF